MPYFMYNGTRMSFKIGSIPSPFQANTGKASTCPPKEKKKMGGCHYGCVADTGGAGMKPIATTSKSWLFLVIFQVSTLGF
jgi:hypothetical protein